MHYQWLSGISTDPSVLQIPKVNGRGPPNNGPKLHAAGEAQTVGVRPRESIL